MSGLLSSSDLTFYDIRVYSHDKQVFFLSKKDLVNQLFFMLVHAQNADCGLPHNWAAPRANSPPS